jgi:sugar phosphate isomerase/epimerase
MFKNLSTVALGVTGTQSEIIEFALSNGFRGLDLDIADFQRQVEAKGLPQSRRLIDSAKLRLGRFALPFDLELDDAAFRNAKTQLVDQARLAADLGCKRAVTKIAAGSDSLPYHQNFEFHRKRLAEIADVLQPHGIRLGVGFQAAPSWRADKSFQFIHQLEPLVMLLGLVGKPNVGLSLDLWDIHVAGGGLDEIRKVQTQQVVTVEVADFPTDTDRGTAIEEQRLLPGETGQIDTTTVLTYLAETGYDGPVTPLSHRSKFAGVRRDEIGRRAGSALDAVWKAAGLSPAGKLATAARK